MWHSATIVAVRHAPRLRYICDIQHRAHADEHSEDCATNSAVTSKASSTLRVAAAQIAPTLGDVDANVTKHLSFIARARDASVDMLVFPELSLTGYNMGASTPELAIGLQTPLTHPALKRIADAAGAMRVVVGFVEEGYGAQFFNSAAVVHEGELSFVHRKLNLANYGDMQEAKVFAQGRYIEPVAITSQFTAAILLCSDMWNPPLVHIAALHGATLLVVPTNSSIDGASGDTTKPARWDLVLGFYASLYGLPIVFANRVGTEGTFHFWGGSRVLDAHGTEVARIDGDHEDLLVADIDYLEVRRARFELPTVRDSNLALIHREIDRLVARIGVPDLLGR